MKTLWKVILGIVALIGAIFVATSATDKKKFSKDVGDNKKKVNEVKKKSKVVETNKAATKTNIKKTKAKIKKTKASVKSTKPVFYKSHSPGRRFNK